MPPVLVSGVQCPEAEMVKPQEESIVDYVTGMATIQEGVVQIGGRSVEEILNAFVGVDVMLVLAHKPDPDNPNERMPPFLWMVQETGVLRRVADNSWQIGDRPFTLDLLPGYRCVLSIVSVEFKVMDPTEMLGSADFSNTEKSDLLATEKRLRAALHNLSGALGAMVGEKE